MSAKEETSPTAAATAPAPSASTTSYANVLQNLEAKASATTPAAVAVSASSSSGPMDPDNKENQPNLKTLKSWSEECSGDGVPEVPLTAVNSATNVSGEKRSANPDNTENSSEVDDNTDFVPVTSHGRKDRKIRRREKQRDRPWAGNNNGNNVNNNNGGGGSRSSNKDNTGSGTGGGGGGGGGGSKGGAAAGGGAANHSGKPDEERKKFPRRPRDRRSQHSKGEKSTNQGSVSGTQKEPKEAAKDRKDSSPSGASANENNNSGNEAKTTTEEQQPKKFVAAPPPKVNAWKISKQPSSSPKTSSSPLDKRVLQPKAQPAAQKKPGPPAAAVPKADTVAHVVVNNKKRINHKASDFSNVGDWPLLLGGKPNPGGGEQRRTGPKNRSSHHDPSVNKQTEPIAAASSQQSAGTQNPPKNVPHDKITPSTSSKTAAVQSNSSNGTVPAAAAASPANAAQSSGAKQPQTTTNNTQQPQQPQQQQQPSAAGTSTISGNSNSAGASNQNAQTSGVNKKIPKHKWRPLQIDVAKSTRNKPIRSRRPPPRVSSENEPRGENETTYDRSSRPRRFRATSYRGRPRGGYSRQGPGRTGNRLPRHLIANGDYVNYLAVDTEHPFVLMGTHYYSAVPATAFIEMETVKKSIRKQVEYYFSEKNLTGDFFLRRKMDNEGYIPVALIASFHRILALTADVSLVIAAIQESDKLDMQDNYKVRTKFNPTAWPIHDLLENIAGETVNTNKDAPVNASEETSQLLPTAENDALTTAINAANSDSSVLNAVPILTAELATKPLASIPPPPVPRNSQRSIPPLKDDTLMTNNNKTEPQVPTSRSPPSGNAISALTQQVERQASENASTAGTGAAAAAAGDKKNEDFGANFVNHLKGLAECVKTQNESTTTTAGQTTGASPSSPTTKSTSNAPQPTASTPKQNKETNKTYPKNNNNNSKDEDSATTTTSNADDTEDGVPSLWKEEQQPPQQLQPQPHYQ